MSDNTFLIEQDIKKLKRKVKLVDPVAIDLKIANKQKKHWIDITDLGAKGDALFYDSVTNKYYSDAGFTTLPTPFGAIFNSASLTAQALGMDLYIPGGTYLIDREMILRSNVNIIGDFGKTTLLLSDTFIHSDNFVFINESFSSLTKTDDLVIEGISVIYEGHVAPTFIDNGLEGMIFKLKNISSLTVSKSSIKIVDKGSRIRATCLWLRGSCSNVSVFDNYIENTSSANTGGCIWISNFDGVGLINKDINIYDNTIVKHSNDEAIAIWGTGISKDINCYDNNFIYESNVNDVVCGKFIATFTSSTGLFENIYIKNNSIKLKGKVGIVFNSSIKSGTFNNVVYDGNIIYDYVGDATSLLSVCRMDTVDITLPETTYDQAYARVGVSYSNNKYTNYTDIGRRNFATTTSCIIKLYNNIVCSKFSDSIIFEESGNSKIISSGNSYNYNVADKYLSWFSEIKGQDTKAYFTKDLIKFTSKLYLRLGGSTSATNTLVEFNSCNINGSYSLLTIQQSGSSSAVTTFTNNVFDGSGLQLYYGDNAYATTLGTLNFINNKFTNSATTLSSTLFTENAISLVQANSTFNIFGNTWGDGSSESTNKVAPTNAGVYKLLAVGKKILNLGSLNCDGWIKNADGSWSKYTSIEQGVGVDIPATTGAITVTMDSILKTITPTGDCTFNGSGGTAGQTCRFVITTSGVTSYNLTWGSNFKPNGVLATGTVTAKTFVVSFVCSGNGYTWIETGRTLAI